MYGSDCGPAGPIHLAGFALLDVSSARDAVGKAAITRGQRI